MSNGKRDRAIERVLMLGTALEGRGGVASVVRIYQESGLFSRWPVTYIATHSGGSLAGKIGRALVAWASFLSWVCRKRSLLHVHGASRASFWRKITFMLPAIWTGRPVIFHLHGAEFMEFYELESGLIRKRIIRYVLDQCTKIIVLAESWRASLATITQNSHIEVIANPGIPISFDPKAKRETPSSLLFLGRLGKRKGVYVLLDAFKLVIGHYPDCKLVCGGDGEIDSVRGAVQSLGLSGHVEILGWVGESERAELLRRSSIFVLPSFAEGLPMSMLEAMSAGLPIICTPVGGIPDAVINGEEGLLVPAGDADELAEAICKLLGDADLREAMGVRARSKFDACFSADVIIPKIESMYRELGVEARESS